MRIENISEDLLTEIKFDKNYKPTDPKNSINPHTRNMKETTPRHVIIKLFKTNDKRKTARRIKDTLKTEKKE